MGGGLGGGGCTGGGGGGGMGGVTAVIWTVKALVDAPMEVAKELATALCVGWAARGGSACWIG